MTLVEMVTSLVILSVLVVGMGSAVLISTRAAEVSSAAEIANPDEIASKIAIDMQTAMGFSERTATAATFSVPDRNGDSFPDTLRYAWGGTPGDPLTLEYNGGAPVTVAENVHQFDLSYLLRTAGGYTPPEEEEEQESEEMVLIFHDDAPKGTFGSAKFSSKYLAAQYFAPTLPTNTVSWKITRVDVRLDRLSDKNILVQIRPADASQKPSAQVLEEVVIPTKSLPWSYVWVPANFTSVSGLDPSTAHCVVLTSDAGGWEYPANVQYERRGDPMTPDTHWLESDDNGASWTNPVNDKDMRFCVYGTVTTLGAPQWP
jgi:hypothetical protein